MKLKNGKFCPLIKKDCKGLECSWFTQVRGTHPQSGDEVDEWACAIAWMPILSINTSKEVRQGAAATEGLRNVIATATAASQAMPNTSISLNTQQTLHAIENKEPQ